MMNAQLRTLVVNFSTQTVTILDVNDEVRLELILTGYNQRQIMSWLENEDIVECYLDNTFKMKKITKSMIKNIIGSDIRKWHIRFQRTYTYLQDYNPEKLNVCV